MSNSGASRSGYENMGGIPGRGSSQGKEARSPSSESCGGPGARGASPDAWSEAGPCGSVPVYDPTPYAKQVEVKQETHEELSQ